MRRVGNLSLLVIQKIMHPFLNIAVRAARDAGSIIVRHIDRIDSLEITSKARNDFVSEVDRQAEDIIIRTLKKAYPDHSFLGEETGVTEGNEYQWIIDPLDGTTNFLCGIPHYSVSIALKHKGRIIQAVVYDPVKDEMFTASAGGGAMLNNRRIRVTQRRNLEGALLATGTPFREDQNPEKFLNSLRIFMKGTSGIRRAGSAALDLAYVAAGRFDGYWEYGVKPWDVAAGMLIVKEAGGLAGDMDPDKNVLENGDILAASPKVYSEMQQKLASVPES